MELVPLSPIPLAAKQATVADLQHPANIFGIPVVYRPQQHGVAYACGIWRFKRIEVNTTWFMLPAHEQQAVLVHEAAHCMLYHIEKRLLCLPICWTKGSQARAREQEFEADAMAVDMGHGFGMLRFLQRAGRVLDAAAGPPTFDQYLERLLSPPPKEREERVMKLLQERHR